MKLISKFQDYYDIGLSMGHDEHVVYVRERGVADVRLSPDLVPWASQSKSNLYGHGGSDRITIRDKANHTSSRYSWWGNDSNSETEWNFYENFVSVAGKAYPVWLRAKADKELLGEQKTFPTGIPLGDVDVEVLKNMMQKQPAPAYQTIKPREPQLIPRKWEKDDKLHYDYARGRFLEHDFTELHLELGAPILLLCNPVHMEKTREVRTNPELHNNIRVIKNPRLADLGMQRALDPFGCFQSVAQFIGGVVPGQQMPMVELSDKSKIEKKGFDPKYGFRTRPA